MIVPNETLIWLLSALWLPKYLIIYWFFIVCIILFRFCQGTDVSVEKEKKGWYINVKKQNVTQRSKKLKQKLIIFLLCLMTLAQIFAFSVKNALLLKNLWY